VSWFLRHSRSRSPDEFNREIGRYLRAAGVDRALEQWSGPFGVRRFVIRFARQGAGVRAFTLDAVRLRAGGGPPLPDPDDRALQRVERALTALYHNMATGPAWQEGAIGYIRDAANAVQLLPLFDEDAADAELDRLPVPPDGHPLEAPDYSPLLAAWEAQMAGVRASTAAVPHDWEEWAVEGDRELVLLGPGPLRRRLRAQPLATFDPKSGRFAWQTGEPLFDEEAFIQESFTASWEAAVELGTLTTARLGARWQFIQPVDERGMVLLVAVFG
jgi:hypothetical protein